MEQGYFSHNELEEISETNEPQLPPLPEELNALGSSFEGMVRNYSLDSLCFQVLNYTVFSQDDLDQLYDHACSFKYHPTRQPDLHWMQSSVVQALTILYHGYLKKERTETDLIRRIWGFIDTCFDHCNDITVNR